MLNAETVLSVFSLLKLCAYFRASVKENVSHTYLIPLEDSLYHDTLGIGALFVLPHLRGNL